MGGPSPRGMNMKFHVLLEPPPEGGFTATCIEIPGAISQGETEGEALDNIADAIRELIAVRIADAEADARTQHATLRTVDIDAEAPT